MQFPFSLLWLAALHLGCTARRTSRSQRNECPRYYLTPDASDATSVPGRNRTANSPLLLHCSHYFTTDALSSFHSCFKIDNSSFRGKPSNDSFAPANVSASDGKKFPAFLKDSSPIGIHHEPQQISSSSNAWSIYPLDDPKPTSLKPLNLHSTHLMGNKPALQQSLSSIKHDFSGFIIPSDSDSRHGNECDLTLRLGSIVAPRTGMESTAPFRLVNGHSSMLEGRKFMAMGHLKKWREVSHRPPPPQAIIGLKQRQKIRCAWPLSRTSNSCQLFGGKGCVPCCVSQRHV